MRAFSVPEFHGAVIPYAQEKSCSDACYRKTAAKHTPREELLRHVGVRPKYIETQFSKALAKRKVTDQTWNWRGWSVDSDVLIHGENGVGKSFIAVELMAMAWRLGVLSQAMIQLPELMTEHFDDGDLEKPIRQKALSVRVAVLDEMGRGRAAGAFAAGIITEIIEIRQSYGRVSILITNLKRSELSSLDSALNDRMTGGTLVIEMGGESLRQKSSARKITAD